VPVHIAAKSSRCNMYKLPLVTEEDKNGTPFTIAYESRVTKKTEPFYQGTGVALGGWREKLQLFAGMCGPDSGEALGKASIVRRLESPKYREKYSVYAAYYLASDEPGGVLAKKYAAWMAIHHTSQYRPHELVFLCVDPRFRRLALGAAMVRHYEILVGILGNAPAEVAGNEENPLAWARVPNFMGPRIFFNNLGWAYLPQSGAMTLTLPERTGKESFAGDGSEESFESQDTGEDSEESNPYNLPTVLTMAKRVAFVEIVNVVAE